MSRRPQAWKHYLVVFGQEEAPMRTMDAGPGLRQAHVRLPDGRSLRTVAAGSGDPLVVFEAGLGDCASIWVTVQRLVAEQTPRWPTIALVSVAATTTQIAARWSAWLPTSPRPWTESTYRRRLGRHQPGRANSAPVRPDPSSAGSGAGIRRYPSSRSHAGLVCPQGAR